MHEAPELLGNIIIGLQVFYTKASHTLIYPMFTALFVLSCVITMALAVAAIKNYLKYNMILFVKLITATIISLLVSLDIYLVAFGKSALFILYIKFQKDLFFIIVACLVGLVCGKILFRGKDSDKVMP